MTEVEIKHKISGKVLFKGAGTTAAVLALGVASCADLRGANLRDANLRGADLGGADLGGANLRGANLRDANLRGANLRDANLGCADLRGANLYGADLRDANLGGADLGGADLRGANLRGANLRDANLRGADLGGADLGGANLRGANLRDANLRGANLRGANLGCANLREVKNLFFQIPQEGELIAWKKVCGGVVKLRVPPEAKRTTTPVGRKCRAEWVEVLEAPEDGRGKHDPSVIYRAGEIVRPDKYDPDIRVECTHGIHFFLTREEAEAY